MDGNLRRDLLYDFYGELLTDRQKRIFEDVCMDDYSVSEVAREEGISRQSVFDTIRRCERSLESYEEKLGLLEKFLQSQGLVEEILFLAEAFEKNPDPLLVKRIAERAEKILEVERDGI